MTKTTLFLAIAATFMIGTSMSFVVSDFEAEAAPKKPKPIPPIDPILKPINMTLNQLESYHEQLVVINFNMVATTDGIGTSPLTLDEAVDLLDVLGQIELEAEDISILAIAASEIITDEAAVCGDGKITPPETCDGILGPQPCSATTCQPIQIP